MFTVWLAGVLQRESPPAVPVLRLPVSEGAGSSIFDKCGRHLPTVRRREERKAREADGGHGPMEQVMTLTW